MALLPVTFILNLRDVSCNNTTCYYFSLYCFYGIKPLLAGDKLGLITISINFARHTR
jgi:hypothetical protein